MQNDFAPAESFWDDFVNSAWNRYPVLLKRMFPCPMAEGKEIFEIIKDASRKHHANSLSTGMNVYVNGGMRMSDLQPYLVEEAENTLEQYCHRIETAPGIQEFTFVLYGCQLYHRRLWTRARRFLQGLYAKVGLPAGHVDLDTFIGKYHRTPTGIHKDAAANFSFVVQGRKTMAFWPSEAFEKSPGTADYTRYPNQRIILEAEPGDVIFWPPQYWHMAISDELAWSVTLNLALYLKRSPLSFVNHAFAYDRNGSRLLQAFNTPSLYQPNAGLNMPHDLQKELELYRNIIRDESLEDAICELWARRVSASGFTPIPPPLSVQDVGEEDVVEKSSEFPIIILPLRDGRAIVAANGHAVWSNEFDKTALIVNKLNSAGEIRMSELVDKYADQKTRTLICRFISQLESFAAFSVKRAEQAARSARVA